MRVPLAVDSEQLVRHDAGQHDLTKWHCHGNQERKHRFRAPQRDIPLLGGDFLSTKALKLFRKLSRARQRCFSQRAIILLIDDRQQRCCLHRLE